MLLLSWWGICTENKFWLYILFLGLIWCPEYFNCMIKNHDIQCKIHAVVLKFHQMVEHL